MWLTVHFLSAELNASPGLPAVMRLHSLKPVINNQSQSQIPLRYDNRHQNIRRYFRSDNHIDRVVNPFQCAAPVDLPPANWTV